MSHSKQPARPRSLALIPTYPVALGLALSLTSCNKSPEMLPAGTPPSQFQSAAPLVVPPPSASDTAVPTMGVPPPVFQDAGTQDASKPPQH